MTRPLRVHQEEGEYEYASYHPHAENGKEETHVEPAVLYQPLPQPSLVHEDDGEQAGLTHLLVPLCRAGSDGPCVREVRVECNDDHRCHGGSDRRVVASPGAHAVAVVGMGNRARRKVSAWLQ